MNSHSTHKTLIRLAGNSRTTFRVSVHISVCALAALLAGPSPALAQPSFQGLGDLPGGSFVSVAEGVSADGAVVVGYSISANGYEAFRWTQAGGMVGLGDLPGGVFQSFARGVSADGGVVVGYSYYDVICDPNVPCEDVYEAFRWTAATGMVGLGHPPGDPRYSYATGVSSDGSVVVGGGYGPYVAFIWDAVHGMVGLTGAGIQRSWANGVSADGAVVIGGAATANGSEAFRWTQAGGMVGLGDLPGGFVISSALDVSADGAVVVGFGNYDADCDPNVPCVYFYEAVRWTQAGGMVGLGDLPGGALYSFADGVSADGAVVVGSNESGIGYEGFIWDAAHGMRSLRDVLTAAGLSLAGWRLETARALSADGRTIVGSGVNPSGEYEGWIARLAPPPCPGDLNGDRAVSLSDLTILLAHFGTPSGATYADGDLDRDGDVDLSDLTFLLSNFGTTCQ